MANEPYPFSVCEEVNNMAVKPYPFSVCSLCCTNGDGSDINPNWTDWRYFSIDNNRNDLVAKLKYSDTSNGKDFSYMLRGCGGLQYIPNFDTSNGENFTGMYYACHSLIYPPTIDTSNGKDFSYMHNCCCNMEDFPDYNLEKAENLAYMYWNCQKMTGDGAGRIHLYLPSAKNIQGMLRNSYKITSVYISGLDSSILENTEEIFNSCSGLLDVDRMVTGKSGAAKMFRGCDKLQSVYLKINSKIPTTATDVWNETFEWCYELTDLEVSGYNKWSGLSLKHSTKLTKDSIENVIKSLYATPYAPNGAPNITLSKTAVDNAFETSEGAADGSTSAEWLELIATKSSWTISLA